MIVVNRNGHALEPGNEATLFEWVIFLFLFIFRWFTHFYAWGVLWNFTVFYHCVSVCVYNKPPTVPYMESALTFLSGLHVEEECHTPGLTQQHFDTLMAMALICLQVSRRLYECLFVSVFSKSKMHFLHYVLGIYFYTALGPTALLHIAPRPSKLSYILPVKFHALSSKKKKFFWKENLEAFLPIVSISNKRLLHIATPLHISYELQDPIHTCSYNPDIGSPWEAR